MDKFGRNYSLSIQTKYGAANASLGTLTIKLPFTIELEIQKNTLSSVNHLTLKIYNLSKYNRNQLRYNIDNYGEYRQIVLQAGYGTNLPVVFKGNVTQAWSVREGNNFITQIEAFDGGFASANGLIDIPISEGTAQSELFKQIIGKLPNVSLGAIGSYPDTCLRGNSYSGSGIGLLSELTGGGFFINNEKAYCLGNSECIAGDLLTINAKSGLLGTPVREDTIFHFDMLFEPRILMGQKITVESKTDDSFNGDYKVIQLLHRATISDAVCGDAVTTAGFFAGTEALKTIQGIL